MIKGVENTEAKKVLLENVIFRKLTLQRAAQTSYRPRADSGLYGFRVQTETITIARSLRDILFILELPFLNLNRSRFLSVVGVSFRQYIPVHLQHKILDKLWWAKQNNHKLLWERSKKNCNLYVSFTTQPHGNSWCNFIENVDSLRERINIKGAVWSHMGQFLQVLRLI